MDFFTNKDSNVFALKNLGNVNGAVMARYSRAKDGLRTIIEKEFIENGELSVDKADDLIERILIQFGDDSVGELEGAHLCLEDISMLATKLIEHRRIGLSPIEKSSRYVDYTTPIDGNFRYYTPKLNKRLTKLYNKKMDEIFINCGLLMKVVKSYLEIKKPITEAEYPFNGKILKYDESDPDFKKFKMTYNNDLKTKTCDVVRSFLPLSTLTNVGLFGNGRSYSHMINHLLSCELDEGEKLGQQAKEELSKLIPHYVRRTEKNEYSIETRKAMQKLADEISELIGEIPMEMDESIKSEYSYALPATIATTCLYPYMSISFQTIKEFLFDNKDYIGKVIKTYNGKRLNRRHRPDRGFEGGYPFTFDLVTEWAVYKDLMRHRMGTIQIQKLDNNLGFNMPKEIEEIGPETLALANKILKASDDIIKALKKAGKHNEVEYCILHGHNVRWMIGMNLRALTHMIELRTTKQGHPNYRRICQKMYRLLKGSYPSLANCIDFVNEDEVYWSRADSEAKQREKEEKL